MKSIYKYNQYGELVNFNTNSNELNINSNLYINEADSFFNSFKNMKHLKKISFNDLQKHKDNVIIFHSK